EQSVMSPAKAQAARGSRVLTGGRFGILGILFSLASACSRNADRLTSFPRRLFRLCVLAAGQLRGRRDLVARSCIRVGDFGVDALVTRRWRLDDSVLLFALRGCLLLRVSVGGASLIYSKAEQQRCDRRGAHCAGMELLHGVCPNCWGRRRNRCAKPSFQSCDPHAPRLDRDAIPCAVPAHLKPLPRKPRGYPHAMHEYRTHACGELRKEDVGKTVRLSGWVHRIRDHGGLLFIDLRDHYGITQAVADQNSRALPRAETLKPEWVVRIDGEVVARSQETINPNLPTGEIEVRIKSLDTLSEAKELPLPVFGEPDYPEETRLKYRFLDLRRESLHKNIMKRQAIIWSLRNRMREAGFFEFQTPILTASSPEGARDYLVPSRIHPGKFYALPQAPQQFKQLIMIAGFDRYFQIAPSFRDEDARAD